MTTETHGCATGPEFSDITKSVGRPLLPPTAGACAGLQIKIEATGTIHPVAHKDRAGKPFASTQYRKLVRYLIAQGVTWDGMAHIENGFWPGE